MSREVSMYIDDMIEAVENVIEFSNGLNRDEFFRDKKSRDATLRNLEVLGEAAELVQPDSGVRGHGSTRSYRESCTRNCQQPPPGIGTPLADSDN